MLGPSILAMVFTFVLTDELAKRIDGILRQDVESHLRNRRRIRSVANVFDTKRERIRHFQGEVHETCREWLRTNMPGMLLTARWPSGAPSCGLLTLAVGRPFNTDDEYMALLGLSERANVEGFAGHGFLFMIYRFGRYDGGWPLAAANEADAIASGDLTNLKVAPEWFHNQISSLLIADGLRSALRSFEPQLGDIRTKLNRLDLTEPAGTQVIGLRNQLLRSSRDVSAICSDVTALVNDPAAIWRDFSSLADLQRRGDRRAPGMITADTARRELRSAVESLQAQEVELRELIVLTTSALNETRTLNLTNTLNRLTWVLVFLTVAVLIVALVQLVRTPGGSPAPSPSAPSSSQAPGSAP